MSTFLGEIIQVIGADGGASAALNSTTLRGIDGVGQQVEGGGTIDPETQEGIQESQEAIEDVVSKLEKGAPDAAFVAETLEKKMVHEGKAVWSGGPKAFGKFLGNELAKGVLFTLGLQVTQTGFQSSFTPSGSVADAGQLKMIQAINQAGKTLQSALDTWSKWQAAHYDERGGYGSLQAMGADIQFFEILQNRVATLVDQRDKLAPLLSKAQQTKALDDVKALLAADIQHARAVVDVSNLIPNDMSVMAAAGLPTMTAEVQAALTTLVSAST
ncbi:hypothetical protein B0H63DRAFT_514176 [Podospora didyma]|uniref:Uncharacterized protein n=1 Tax=Podospora didyma TaxID=330526 RepID=A0AAE0K5T6_9PEZI|nr:hypothetical protein B0H63DRAFT_514176 [Podospora didyma]